MKKQKKIFSFESIIFDIKRLYKFSLCLSLDFLVVFLKLLILQIIYYRTKLDIYSLFAVVIFICLLLEIHINLSLVSSKQILCVVSALSGIEEDDSLFWFCILQIRWSNKRTALSLVSDMV